MKTIVQCFVIMGIAVVLLAPACRARAAEKETAIDFKSDADKVSYLIGMDMGANFLRGGMDIDPEFLVLGLKDALAEREPAISEDESKRIMTALQERMQAKQAEMMKKQNEDRAKMAEGNKVKSQEFLDENKKKPGVKALESGLQYKVLVEGKGPKPKPTDQVKVHYRGTLMDGTEFDSSYKRNQPFKTFAGRGIIKGWQEALQIMPEGSKWQIYLPPDLAYGDKGTGGIPPGSALIFEIELLEIVASSE